MVVNVKIGTLNITIINPFTQKILIGKIKTSHINKRQYRPSFKYELIILTIKLRLIIITDTTYTNTKLNDPLKILTDVKTFSAGTKPNNAKEK